MTALEFNTQLFTLKGKAEFFASKGEKQKHIAARETARDLEHAAILRGNIVRYNPKIRSTEDARRKVSRILVSYYDKAGYEYRKSFTGPVNTPQEVLWQTTPEVILL